MQRKQERGWSRLPAPALLVTVRFPAQPFTGGVFMDWAPYMSGLFALGGALLGIFGAFVTQIITQKNENIIFAGTFKITGYLKQ
jgi:hypothetical protein